MESPQRDGLNGHSNGIHDSPPTPDPSAPPPPPSNFDPELFRGYLLALLPPLTGADPAELDVLFDSEYEEKVSKFAAEGANVIYVVKAREGPVDSAYAANQQAQVLTYVQRRPTTTSHMS